jgi:ATP-dependent Clp protease protease subunit
MGARTRALGSLQREAHRPRPQDRYDEQDGRDEPPDGGVLVNEQQVPAMARAESPGFGLNDHIYNRLLRERIIWLGSEVRDENANAICAQMMLLAAEDPEKDIWLYINSPGGSITAGMAIYDTMQYIQPDVATIAMGMAASMGQFLLSSGAKGKRYATPHARVMMHQPSGGIGGTATDVRINAQLILHMKTVLAELTAAQTGKTPEQINADADRDRWFTAQEALEYGFVDHVVASAGSVAGGGGTA